MSRPYLRIAVFGAVAALAAGGLFAWPWTRAVWIPNHAVEGGGPVSIYIRAGDDMESVLGRMEERGLVRRPADFRRVAGLMSFGPAVKPGHYLVAHGMTSRDLISRLRLGQQDPLRLTFGKFRRVEDLAGHLGERLSPDSADFAGMLTDPARLEPFGLDPETALGAFVPNTYEVWWHTSPENFLRRMVREREQVWDDRGRRERAARIGLTPAEVTVLASIVEEEQARLTDEWPRIAGVYLNRIDRGMRLEADPTVKYALGRFDITRVLDRHKEAAAGSPWNTYAAAGLPPGPICNPGIAAIDAVLWAEEHDYLFMCARADMSGYHAFASSLGQHLRNARLYQAELNRRRIYD